MISTVDFTPIEPLITEAKRLYADTGFSYGWKSNVSREYDHGHWNNMILPSSKVIGYDHNKLQYIEQHPVIQEIWNSVQEVIGTRTLVRAYTNGYTYGTDAYYHIDDRWLFERYGPDITSETVIIYLNDEWNRDWGGETSILDEQDNFLASVFPKKNRALLFNSNLLHRGNPLTRSCPVLRSVLVFKTAGRQYNETHVEWIKRKTEHIPHSGTTLFNHLYNTALTVESFKEINSATINAALYHSVYGTEFFDPKINTTRGEVINKIGKTAEDLVYTFCKVKNRFNTILNNTENWNKEKHLSLLLIELANTLEMQERRAPNDKVNEQIRLLDNAISGCR